MEKESFYGRKNYDNDTRGVLTSFCSSRVLRSIFLSILTGREQFCSFQLLQLIGIFMVYSSSNPSLPVFSSSLSRCYRYVNHADPDVILEINISSRFYIACFDCMKVSYNLLFRLHSMRKIYDKTRINIFHNAQHNDGILFKRFSLSR